MKRSGQCLVTPETSCSYGFLFLKFNFIRGHSFIHVNKRLLSAYCVQLMCFYRFTTCGESVGRHKITVKLSKVLCRWGGVIHFVRGKEETMTDEVIPPPHPPTFNCKNFSSREEMKDNYNHHLDSTIAILSFSLLIHRQLDVNV